MKTAKEYIERMQTDKEFGAQMQQKILAAKQAGAEDLFAAASAAAKELGYDISPDQIRELGNQSEDISDEELGKLAGGSSCTSWSLLLIPAVSIVASLQA